MIDNNRQRYATMGNERMKAKKNPGMTFERFIEAVMACEIVLRNYHYYYFIACNIKTIDSSKLKNMLFYTYEQP